MERIPESDHIILDWRINNYGHRYISELDVAVREKLLDFQV